MINKKIVTKSVEISLLQTRNQKKYYEAYTKNKFSIFQKIISHSLNIAYLTI